MMCTDRPNGPDAAQDSTESIRKKARKAAWCTAFAVPILYILASGTVIGHAGLGGIFLLGFYLVASLLVVPVLRLLLAPYYRLLLDKTARPVLKRVLLGAGAVLLAGYLCLLCQTAFFPYDSVNNAVKEIPEMQQYFTAHRQEFDAQRLQSDDPEQFCVRYDEKSSGFFVVSFCYGSTPVSTGYQQPYRYTHALDEHWYLELYLLPAI